MISCRNIGHRGKKSVSGYKDRRFKLRLHQYVVSMSKTLYSHRLSRLSSQISTRCVCTQIYSSVNHENYLWFSRFGVRHSPYMWRAPFALHLACAIRPTFGVRHSLTFGVRHSPYIWRAPFAYIWRAPFAYIWRAPFAYIWRAPFDYIWRAPFALYLACAIRLHLACAIRLHLACAIRLHLQK